MRKGKMREDMWR